MAITTYTAGQVLTAASLNNNFASGGLQFIKSQTIGSAVASVEVTGAFSATYDNYKIIVTGGAASTTASLNLTFGATATGYYRGRAGYTFASVDGGGGVANGTSFSGFGSGTTSALHMNLDVYSPFLADETSATSMTVQMSTLGAGYFLGGYLNNTTSYTAFTLTASTGTLTGGTIRVYGYAND
jgi:hypothetical protein